MGYTIGIDVGGTKVAGGIVDEKGAILKRTRRDTPSTDPQATGDTVALLVQELAASRDVEAVGIGAAADLSRLGRTQFRKSRGSLTTLKFRFRFCL